VLHLHAPLFIGNALTTTLMPLPDNRFSPAVLGAVLATHLLGLWLLASYHRQVAELIEQPIIVSLLPAEPESTPQPAIIPPRIIPPVPKPLPKQPVTKPAPQPEAAKPVEQLVAQAPQSHPAPAIEAAPQPSPQPEAVAAPEPAPADKPAEAMAAPEPEPVEQPRFNADYLNNPAPGYPPLSKRLREEGTVMLRVRVDADGRAAEVQLRQSSGHARLDDRALETVKRWKFVPARQGGQPVEAWVIVPIQFSLKG